MNSPQSLLFLGATGYFSCSKRKQAQLLKEKGIKAVVLAGGLDDTTGLIDLARQHDIVLNGATGFHASSSRAFIEGLAQRQETSDAEVFYIHLSGTSNLAIGDVLDRQGELRTFSDNEEGIYEYEVEREVSEPYGQRTADVTVVQTGDKFGGAERRSIQPAGVHPPGTSTLGHVHVTDLAALFKVVLINAIINPSLPAGRRGYFFANTGCHSWLEVARRLAKAGHALGHFKSPGSVGVSLTEIAAKLYNGDEVKAERVHASSSSTVAVRVFELGWTPVKTEENWQSYAAEAFETKLE
ncbi:uncharacterized protein BKA55DRAFT_722999 [Fusarium redolens]|uniref:NmrA-like domain-containing protein n=1 Tax=Fusarium redolens TaxID=48865 RepID=A0A9P9FXX7_FUSRE|nr:uncharacterized protein BKA55DRAFT_722999 [Fusarium redolens]KAH7204856.1 hypothetical protein BKA55DRAFT_722999 [Fusarium redolens]